MPPNLSLREIAWNGFPSSSETCVHWEVLGLADGVGAQIFRKVSATGKSTYETRRKQDGKWSSWTGSFGSREEAVSSL